MAHDPSVAGFLAVLRYVAVMVRQYEYQPCIPTRGTKVPAGPDWIHEIKHDGYRLIVQREGKRVRLLQGAAMIGRIDTPALPKPL